MAREILSAPQDHELYRDEYAVKLARALGEGTGIRLESEVRKVFELAKANGRTKPVPRKGHLPR